jgi:HEAT repeat protein
MEWVFRGFWFAGWLLLLLGAVLTLRALFGDLARGRKRCPKCWYDMSGAPGLQCPECGRKAKSPRALFRTRRKPFQAVAGMAVVFLALVAWRVPLAISKGWWAAVPTPALVVLLQFWDDDAQGVFQRVQGRLAANPTSLGSWEKLLLARHCGAVLDRPDAALTAPPTSIQASIAAVISGTSPAVARAASVRRAAIAARMGGPGSIAPTTTHAEALDLLMRLGPSGRPAVPALVRLLDNPSERLDALRTLQAIGPRAGHAIARVLDLTADPTFDHYRLAFDTLKALSASTDNAFQVAYRVIESERDLLVKLKAASFLIGTFPHDRTIAAFERLLKGPNATIRLVAARGLEQMGIPAIRSIPAITDATRDRTFPLAATGVSVLSSFKGHAVSSLAELVMDPNSDVARPAAVALGRLGPAAVSAVPALIRALDHPDRFVPPHAATSLGLIGPVAGDAIPELESVVARGGPGAKDAEWALNAIKGRGDFAPR